MEPQKKNITAGNAEKLQLNNSNSSKQNKELVTRKQIPGTPFTIIGANGKWWGTMGKYRLTEQLNTEEDAVLQCTAMTWDRIIQVMQALIEMNDEEENVFKRRNEIREELEKKLEKETTNN